MQASTKQEHCPRGVHGARERAARRRRRVQGQGLGALALAAPWKVTCEGVGRPGRSCSLCPAMTCRRQELRHLLAECSSSEAWQLVRAAAQGKARADAGGAATAAPGGSGSLKLKIPVS